MPRRQLILIVSLAVIFGAAVIYHWISGREGVTLDFDNVPAGKVIKTLERKAGIQIVTNGDLTAPISIHLHRAPVYDAVDTVATRMNGNLRIGYVGAPNGRQIDDALAAFATNANPGGWAAFSAGGGWGGGNRGNRPERAGGDNPTATQPGGETRQDGERRNAGGGGRGPGGGGGQGGGGFGGGMEFGSGDPRFLTWTLSEMTDRNLQAYLNQGAQKTGAFFAVPQDWNPVLTGLPKSGPTHKVAQAIASAGKGKMEEIFLITVNARPETAEESQPRFTPTIFTPQSGPERNQEWVAERVQAQIASLPTAERVQAQKDMDEMRAFRESLRGLSDEERRAKWEELMKRPDVQEKMEERQAARDAKNSPDQRDQRARDYLSRKQAAKGEL